MTIVAVVGDACTTTTVALAAAWPSSANAIVVEADPTGGDLAAWFDLPVEPSLSTLVTRTIDGTFAEVDRHTRLAGSGLRLIPAPSRAGEAQQAVAEAARTIVASVVDTAVADDLRRHRSLGPATGRSIPSFTPPRWSCSSTGSRRSRQPPPLSDCSVWPSRSRSAKRELPRSSSRSSEQPRSISTRSRPFSPMASDPAP